LSILLCEEVISVAEKALGLVVRTTDWSETSRIATIWTREFGKVRVLAKGGRRLKSNFESALDLLTLCSIVLLRKSSGTLDLLTEAQVVQRFPQLRRQLAALYAATYMAELLGEGTEDYDPHPALFDEAVRTLEALGTTNVQTGICLARFELRFWRELGYGLVLEKCAICEGPVADPQRVFSAAEGGVLCGNCQREHKQTRLMSAGAWQGLCDLSFGEQIGHKVDSGVLAEIRLLLNDYVTYWWGRRPRLLPYLGIKA
jgi:DNA repair protein RecO (recombination protein O)